LTAPALLVFSSQSSCHHRDVLSFPTRRSSDLGGTGIKHCRGAAARSRARERVVAAGFVVLHRRCAGVGDQPEPDAHPGRSAAGVDRKSTRLNSSHVSISYAVFCLKKKKDYYTC